MPSFNYGARQFSITIGPFATASTAANSTVAAFQYKPALTGTGSYGTVDFAQETIKQATLIFMASVASAATTGASLIIAASQFNSGGSSVASVTLYDQSLASQTSLVPLDVSTKLNTWNLSPGDQIVIFANSHTVGLPASFPTLVLSGTIDTVTSS